MKFNLSDILLILVFLFIGYIHFHSKEQPDLIINGEKFLLRKKCIKEEFETTYELHDGYNFDTGEYEMYFGPIHVSKCIKYKIDTIQIKD